MKKHPRWPTCPKHWDETTEGFLTELLLAMAGLGILATMTLHGILVLLS